MFLHGCVHMQVTEETRSCQKPWSWSYKLSWPTLHGCWKPNSGPLQEQQLLSHPSSPSHIFYLINIPREIEGLLHHSFYVITTLNSHERVPRVEDGGRIAIHHLLPPDQDSVIWKVRNSLVKDQSLAVPFVEDSRDLIKTCNYYIFVFPQRP